MTNHIPVTDKNLLIEYSEKKRVFLGYNEIKKAVKNGEMDKSEFKKYKLIFNSLIETQKGFNDGRVNHEELMKAFEKFKNYKFVRINRDGKTTLINL